jgi:hypothetical protein
VSNIVSNELAKPRSQSTIEIAAYMREIRAAIADVRHRLRMVQDWMEMQPLQDKS